MAAYTVLATRYRPRVFEDVVGQEDTARVLASAITGGRAGHAFLFSGPRGVGKTSMARILAKAFDCLENDQGQPCGTCRVCAAIDQSGDCLDVVEIDGASHNRVENVREVIENLRFRPVEARYRIYIIDEVHMLSTAAFNALLKTLEEPPEHAKFILATTEPLKVPETIRSRCQVYDFRRLTAEQITARLAFICGSEGVAMPDGLLTRVARHAQGGLRDALSLLDQLITYGQGAPSVEDFERLTGRLSPELLHRLIEAALAGDTGEAHAAADQALRAGARPADLLGQLTELLEGLLVTAAGGEPADRTPEERDALTSLAGRADVDRVVAMLDVLVEAERRLRTRADGRLVVEMAVINLARLQHLTSLSELLSGGGGAEASPAGSGTRSSSGGGAARPSAGPGPRGGSPAPAARPTDGPSRGPAAPPSARAASAARATTSSRAAPAVAAPGDPAAFREAFLAAVPQRSLRLELSRYEDIRVEGDRLVLRPFPGGPTALFDPGKSREVADQVRAAAERAAGRRLQLELKPASAPDEAPPSPAAAGPAGAPPAAPSAAPPAAPSAAPPEPEAPAARGPAPAETAVPTDRAPSPATRAAPRDAPTPPGGDGATSPASAAPPAGPRPSAPREPPPPLDGLDVAGTMRALWPDAEQVDS